MNTQLRDLSTCPIAIRALDSNAEHLWRIFLKKARIPMAGSKVIEGDGSPEHETKRASIVRRFGIPSLEQRLVNKDEIQRAKVWWRESVACSEGESEISGLTPENMYVINPFIVTESLKFKDPRVERLTVARDVSQDPSLKRRGRPAKGRAEKRATNAARMRRFRATKRKATVTLKSAPQGSSPFFCQRH
jgi:hypothetical protein